MYLVYYGVAAFLGGVVSGLIGWLRSNPPEPFNCRKFLASSLTSVVSAGLGMLAGSILPPATQTQFILLIVSAFIAGAGVDAIRNNAGLK